QGYWSTRLGSSAAQVAIVPYAAELSPRTAGSTFSSLSIVVGEAPSAATLANVEAAASWAAAHGTACGVADGAGVTGLRARQAGGLAPPLGADTVVLDARADGGGE